MQYFRYPYFLIESYDPAMQGIDSVIHWSAVVNAINAIASYSNQTQENHYYYIERTSFGPHIWV